MMIACFGTNFVYRVHCHC